MKGIALVGGPKSEWPAKLKTILQDSSDLKIGVDRGSLLLLEMGLNCDLAVGDFDSLHPAELSKVEKAVKDIRYSNPVKDLTDTELMLRAAFADYQLDYLTIYGATGGRIDHFLSNLLMFLKPEFLPIAEKVSLIDQQNKLIFLRAGQHQLPKLADYPYFAVIPLTPIKQLTIENARYCLQQARVKQAQVFASNEFLSDRDNCQIELDQGLVLIVYSRDLDRYLNA
jgi:thiamine pyrophosphokinase